MRCIKLAGSTRAFIEGSKDDRIWDFGDEKSIIILPPTYCGVLRGDGARSNIDAPQGPLFVAYDLIIRF